jgi:hypothetical protein
MEKKPQHCQHHYGSLLASTWPDTRLAMPLRGYWLSLRKLVWSLGVLGLDESIPRIFLLVRRFSRLGTLLYRLARKGRSRSTFEILDLKAGDWVEVRSAKEISATLNREYALRGLVFTPEMAKFCGKKFRVYKKLDKIILDTGEPRKIKSPTVILEGVFCDGRFHGGCDKSCFCFWREEWLKRASQSIGT